jgi:hypothetical protein
LLIIIIGASVTCSQQRDPVEQQVDRPTQPQNMRNDATHALVEIISRIGKCAVDEGGKKQTNEAGNKEKLKEVERGKERNKG